MSGPGFLKPKWLGKNPSPTNGLVALVHMLYDDALNANGLGFHKLAIEQNANGPEHLAVIVDWHKSNRYEERKNGRPEPLEFSIPLTEDWWPCLEGAISKYIIGWFVGPLDLGPEPEAHIPPRGLWSSGWVDVERAVAPGNVSQASAIQTLKEQSEMHIEPHPGYVHPPEPLYFTPNYDPGPDWRADGISWIGNFSDNGTIAGPLQLINAAAQKAVMPSPSSPPS